MSNYNVIIPYYSVMLADSLVPIIQENYAFKNRITMELVTAAMNDVYKVKSGDNIYFLKIPRNDRFWPYSDEVYKFELDLLNYLRKQKFKVSYPIPLKSKKYLGIINAAEGIRYYELFTKAEGEEPDVTNLQHMQLVGSYLGRFHNLTSKFKSEHKGIKWDFDLLIKYGFDQLEKNITNEFKEDIKYLRNQSKNLIKTVNSKLSGKKNWGIIHGDYSPKNIRIKNNKVQAFDFDSCGYGYFIYDFAYIILKTNYKSLKNKYIQAFLDGYQSVRQLTDEELDALLPLSKLMYLSKMTTNAGFYNLVGSEWFENKMREDIKVAYKLFS